MIPIRNIYYMLSYAFSVLNKQGYRELATESFKNAAELCAAILHIGISHQIKRGLGRNYITETESVSSLRGKIDLSQSIKTQSILKNQMVCQYDDFSVNTYMNRILKTTMMLLMHADISRIRKKELRKVLVYFDAVDGLDVRSINWNLQFNRNNHTYSMLVSICYLVVKGLLQTQSDGKTRLMEFVDEKNMARLYEKFILEYYRKEHPYLDVCSSRIMWQLDDDMNAMLPIMQTDIMLSKDEKILIIEAKYYARITRSRFETKTLHSNNLYQLFAYVKNKEAELCGRPHEVSGMLLYARTDEEILPDYDYRMSGNKISVRTLDLGCSFEKIKAQFDSIAYDYFS